MPPRFIESRIFDLLDLLDADGGWLTTAILVEVTPHIRPDSVKKNLRELEKRGFVKSRPRVLREEGSPEYEWRITPEGRAKIDEVAAA